MDYFNKDVEIDGKLWEGIYHRVDKCSMEIFDIPNSVDSENGSESEINHIVFDKGMKVFVVVNVYHAERALENRANPMLHYIVELDYDQVNDIVSNQLDDVFTSIAEFVEEKMMDVDLTLSVHNSSSNFVSLK